MDILVKSEPGEHAKLKNVTEYFTSIRMILDTRIFSLTDVGHGIEQYQTTNLWK